MSVFTNPSSHSPEQARAYTTAVVELVGTSDPFDVLRSTPSAVRRAVEGLSDGELSAAEAPGKWSLREVVRHLADAELAWSYRIRMVLAQERPLLTGYDQDAWARRLRYDLSSVEESLDEFATSRRSNLRLLERASPEDLSRIGVHAERGEESIAHMLRLNAGHDLLHLRQLERIRLAIASKA